jgi:hypothetical protein
MSTPKPARPWRMFLPLIAVIVLWCAWSIYWYAVFTTTQSIYAREAETLTRQGISLTCAEQRWGGYPFRVEMNCTRPSFNFDQQGRKVTANAGNLLAIMQAYNFNHIIALLDGPTSLQEEGRPPLTATHDRAIASFRVTEEQTARMALEVAKLDIGRLAKSSSVIVNAELNPAAPSRLSASLTGLAVKPADQAEVQIGDTAFEATAPPALVASPDPVRAAIATGERITLNRFEIRQGALTVSANGEVGLDPQGKPAGKVSTKASDLNLLLEWIKSAFNFEEKKIAPLRTILGMLQGGKPSIAADLIARDGALFWGPIKLADLRPVIQ